MCRVPRRKLLRRGSNKGDRCVCDGPLLGNGIVGVHELRSGAVPGERRGVELHDLRSRDVPAKLRRVGLRLLYCGLRIDGDWGVGFGSLFGRYL